MSIAEKITRLNTAKNDIATAIINKGVTVAETDGFEEFADKIDSISGGGGTAVPSDVVAGKTFSSDAGTELVGTMASYTDEEIVVDNPETITQNVFDGFVAVSTSSRFSYSSHYSQRGDEWVAIDGIGDKPYTSVAYGNGKIICINDGVPYYSIDKQTWTAMDAQGMKYVAYGDGKFVGVGNANGTAYYLTDDNLSWVTLPSITADTSFAKSITYGDGKFVCAGGTKAGYSHQEGVIWTCNTIASVTRNTINDVAYGNGKFVAVGNYGAVYYSLDGETWTATSASSANGRNMNNICYADGKFVSVSAYNLAHISDDGVTWKNWATGITGTTSCYGVAYGDDKFITIQGSSVYYRAINSDSWTYLGGFNNDNQRLLISINDDNSYLEYTIPEGYHSSQKILLKK